MCRESSKLRKWVWRVSMHYYVRGSFGPHLSTKMDSGAVTCLTDLNLASLLRWTPALLYVSRLGDLPFWEGSSGAITCHTAPSGLWTAGIKKKLSCSRHAASLMCFQSTLVRSWSACKPCRPIQCGYIVQYRPSWPLLNTTTVVIWPDRTVPRRWQCSVQRVAGDKIRCAHAVEDIICYS
jgi:hypothetical protein